MGGWLKGGEQPELPFQGCVTSVSAAHEIERCAETMRGEVYRWLLEQGKTGATDEEMQRHLPMAQNTQRPRRRELELKGAVRDSGAKRRTQSGRMAIVWVCGRSDG